MTVECPAPGCDFEGLVDQVAGHIGGRTDEVHDGMVPTAVRGGIEQESSGGIPLIVIALGVVALGLAVSSYMVQTGSEVEEVGINGA